METVLIVGTLVTSFLGAMALQRAALEGLLRAMNADRRARQ
jgi:hypothetical protein